MADEPEKTRDDYPVGSTAVASILGLNPYETPLGVYRKLRGIEEEERSEPSEPAFWGTRLEPLLKTVYSERHPDRLFWTPPGGEGTAHALTHPSFPWVVDSPDMLGGKEPLKPDIVVEIKTASLRFKHKWGGGEQDIPEEYLCQCVWHMFATDLGLCDCAVLIGGQEYREYSLRRDKEVEGMIVERVKGFLDQHVVPGVPPPPQGSEADEKALRAIYRKVVDDVRPATERETELLMLYADKRQQADKALAELEMFKQELMAVIGEHSGIEAKDIGKITWKLAKGTETTNWQGAFSGLANLLELPPDDPQIKDMIAQYTGRAAGSRRFCYYDLSE